MAKQFNLIGFQDSLIEKLEYIAGNGVGEHKARSRSRARRNAVRELVALGYTQVAADAIVRDACEMADLNLVGELAEGVES